MIFCYHNDIGGIEHNVIFSICNVIAGEPLYEDPQMGNFNITQYTPVYYFINLICCEIFNLNPLDNLFQIYIIGRSLSFLFNILSAYIVYKILKSFKVRKELILIALTLFFVCLTRIHFSTRPDSLFCLIFLSFLHIGNLLFKENNSRKINITLLTMIIFLSVISIFIKQTGIEFFFIVSSFFIISKRFFNLVIYVSSYILLTYLIYQLISQVYGSNFILNVYFGLKNGGSFVNIYDVFSIMFSKNQILIFLFIFSMKYFFSKKYSLEKRFIGYCSILTFGFAFVTSFKDGSSINYYNEFITSIIIVGGIEFENIVSRTNISSHLSNICKLFLFSFLVVFIPFKIINKYFHEHSVHLKYSKQNFIERIEAAQFLKRNLTGNDYFISFDSHINSMLPKRCLIPNKDIVPQNSPFSYKEFYNYISNKKIKYLVVQNNNHKNNFMNKNIVCSDLKYKNKEITIYQNILFN